jgi:hemoglobin
LSFKEISMIHMPRALAALATALTLSAACAQPGDDSLYRAWGQKAGIQAVMQDFVTRLQSDPRMAPFFKDTNRDHLVTQLTEQLCEQAGGPCTYKGVPMKEAHEALQIRRRDFNALVEVLQQSMDAKGVPFSAQNAMLARLAPMHRDIVNSD